MRRLKNKTLDCSMRSAPAIIFWDQYTLCTHYVTHQSPHFYFFQSLHVQKIPKLIWLQTMSPLLDASARQTTTTAAWTGPRQMIRHWMTKNGWTIVNHALLSLTAFWVMSNGMHNRLVDAQPARSVIPNASAIHSPLQRFSA